MDYPPLVDPAPGAMTAQYVSLVSHLTLCIEPHIPPPVGVILISEADSLKEHTILIRPTCKEVISRGDDY